MLDPTTPPTSTRRVLPTRPNPKGDRRNNSIVDVLVSKGFTRVEDVGGPPKHTSYSYRCTYKGRDVFVKIGTRHEIQANKVIASRIGCLPNYHVFQDGNQTYRIPKLLESIAFNTLFILVFPWMDLGKYYPVPQKLVDGVRAALLKHTGVKQQDIDGANEMVSDAGYLCFDFGSCTFHV